MDSRGVRRNRSDEEEESYFISMSDMMVGVLFIFIILMLYFALQFRQTTEIVTGARETRKEILEKLKGRIDTKLKPFGLTVETNTDTGVLSIPNKDNILFDTAKYDLSPRGQQAMTAVAEVLEEVLPCYATLLPTAPPRQGCTLAPHQIDAIFVEGHTDAVPLNGSGQLRDNLDLSALRATHTFKEFLRAQPALDSIVVDRGNGQKFPILSVSGYGERRPLPVSTTASSEAERNARNRRIDLRILMVPPKCPTCDEISQKFAGAAKPLPALPPPEAK